MRSLVVALVVAFAWLGWCPAVHAEVPVSDAAREIFKRGVVLLTEKRDYQAAYDAFKSAFADSPSPKILGNLGLAAMHLERDGEAIEAYERYLAEAGAVSDTENQQIIEDLVRLRRRVARVRIAVQPPGLTIVDERLVDGGPPVVNEYRAEGGEFRAGVHRGRHRMTLQHPGYEPTTWEFQAKPGPARERSVSLRPTGAAPAAAPSAPGQDVESSSAFPSTGFLVSASVTGGLGIATIVMGVVALSNKSSFEEAVARGDDVEARDLRDSGQTFNIVTDVFLVSTVVGAALTSVFLVMDLGSDGEASSALRVLPSVGPGRWGDTQVGVTLQGAL